MIKVFSGLILTGLFCLTTPAQAEIKLGASPLATYIDNGGEPARLNSIVTEAFRRMDTDVTLQVMRRAFLGGALTTGQLNGEYAFISLDDKQSNALYSTPYLPLYLYAASKRPAVKEIKLLPQLQDSRIAIENRFANTTQIRAVREVKWSRTPTTFDAFKQFADDRTPLLMTSALLIDEFNLLLLADNEELVSRSADALITSGFHLMLAEDTAANRGLISTFNDTISQMQSDGTYNTLLGKSWLSKDINNDGIADYITSESVFHNTTPPSAATAYPLDSTRPAAASVYMIDGNRYDNWQDAVNALQALTPAATQLSLLDADIYKKIIRQW